MKLFTNFVADRKKYIMQAITTTATAAPALTLEKCSALTTAFISGLDRTNKTAREYERNIARFFSWVQTSGRDLAALTDADIVAYKRSLEGEGKSLLTINAYMVAVRRFFVWTERRKLYPNIAAGIEVRGRKATNTKQHLTADKSEELQEYFKARSLRDYAIVSIMLELGLRTIEISRLKVEDMTIRNGAPCLRIWGKGHKEADTLRPLSWKAYGIIKGYLAERPTRKGEPLFISEDHKNKGGALNPGSISRICRQGLDAIGLDSAEFTAHSLRHTAAVNMLENGGGLYEVQFMLRHANSTTTEIYLQSLEEDKKISRCAELLNSIYKN